MNDNELQLFPTEEAENQPILFEGKYIRHEWVKEEEDWFFSVADVVEVLTDSLNPSDYIKKMKKRDPELAKGWGQIVTPLAMDTAGGRQRVNCANAKGILRIIQSIPSKKAEPFKMWLAQVGADRLDEMIDPEKAITRSVEYYRAKGYTEGWISQRMQGVDVRNELTDEWKQRGVVTNKEYAILTNEMTQACFGLSVAEYKEVKGLKKENLRDNMTNLELVLNMLAEVSTTAISRAKKPATFAANKQVAREGGNVARNARLDLEKQIGESVISPLNAKDKQALEVIDANALMPNMGNNEN